MAKTPYRVSVRNKGDKNFPKNWEFYKINDVKTLPEAAGLAKAHSGPLQRAVIQVDQPSQHTRKHGGQVKMGDKKAATPQGVNGHWVTVKGTHIFIHD